ncbi:MAG: hypothetical protein FWE88_06270 [Phycisphaerae bacterium]|nr:hypothetical protein [Phycisphaerae bacterium]
MDDRTEEQKLAEYERRAPGWVVRCLRCGFTEPWGKHGYRIRGRGNFCTITRCSRCSRYCCHRVEKRKEQ